MADNVADVVIVGAGLSGLACAGAMRRAGLEPLVLEASDGVGGRVRTDVVDGYRLDRGFQVFLTAYPTARTELDYGELDLQPFEPGALVRLDGSFHRVADPFRRPASGPSTLRAPIGTLRDKVLIASLALRLRRKPLPAIWSAEERPTREYLQDLGFTDRMVDSFFRPFLGGVFLDPSLDTSSRMFEFVFRLFGEDDVAVPAEGMGRLSAQLAGRLPEESIRLETPVRSVHAGGVVLEGGETIDAAAVVVATDGPEARRLLGLDDVPRYRRALCLYFSTESPPVPDGILVLDGEGRGPVTNLAVMSRISPAYAPPGRELVSATILADAIDEADVRARARRQLTDWFGPQVAEWEEVGEYRIEVGLPDLSPRSGGVRNRPLRAANGVYVCGDHRWHGSIEGALQSGKATAEAVCRELGASS